MAKEYLESGKPCSDPQMHKIKAIHGEAKPQPDQGKREPASGDSTATLAGRGTMEE